MRRKSNKRQQPLDETAARKKCLRLLSVRARSVAELRQRLMQDGFEQSITDTVTADLTEAGLLDDEEFARSWIASRKTAGIGRRKLALELRRKGVERRLTERLIAELLDERTEREQAETLARKRLGAEWDVKALIRIRRLLLSRGYGFGIVDDVLQAIAGKNDGVR